MPWPVLVLFAASVLASLACVIHLWRRRDGLGKKTVWTIVLVLPLFGPLLYGSLYSGLTAQPEGERAKELELDTLPGAIGHQPAEHHEH
jgi:hypothetical protein